MNRSFIEIDIIDFTPAKRGNTTSNVILEAPIDISVNSKYWVTLMCTPNNIEELAIGFLFNEGVINSAKDIKLIDICDNEKRVDVWLTYSVKLPNHWKRTSGCTGGATSVELANLPNISIETVKIHGEKLLKLNDQLLSEQEIYSISGGVHSSALSDGEEILVVMEDIGRHNTLDKIAGWCIKKSMNITPSILLTTGRISSEMLQKSSRIGASILISRTAPSSLAIELAHKLGICLIGYARRDRLRIYSNPEYVTDEH